MDVGTSMIWAGALLAAMATLCLAGLRGWHGWIELKKAELALRASREELAPELPPAVRIELATLKERLRKLEAIARGVDL